jgi:hypothetical protein
MNAKMSQQLTLLGLGAMAFYGFMLASGALSIEVMPQFAVSALIFLTAGRLMRRASRVHSADEDAPVKPKKRNDADWPWLTGLLNWTAALLIFGTMGIFLMKPAGVSLGEALHHTVAHEQFYAGAVP